MSTFDIDLQISSSEKNKLDKHITTISALSGTLRNGTSIIDPVITFEGDISNFVECNYMTIPAFNRSYFVTNIIEISAHVDVLSTYAAEIRSNSAILHRQEHKWNLYLNDGVFKIYQNPMILAKAFPSGFNTQEFVLAVAGS